VAHTTVLARVFAGLVSTLALSALGCVTEVSGGDGGEGGGDDGEGAACAAYTGAACTPGAQRGCTLDPPVDPVGSAGVEECYLVEGCETAWTGCGPGNTPLVFSFDGAPVDYLADAAHAFDVNGAQSQVTDWPTARTPWLAIDRDGNGAIEDGRELFGSLSPLPGGGRAPNGFVALRALDGDGDGRITPADPGFARLLVWSDHDGDRASTPAELRSAASFEITSIDLDYSVSPRCDTRGNCDVERAAFRFRDATGIERTGLVIDVHLPAQR
jgi:hypothetical protein